VKSFLFNIRLPGSGDHFQLYFIWWLSWASTAALARKRTLQNIAVNKKFERLTRLAGFLG
jgi:hypothetical protein